MIGIVDILRNYHDQAIVISLSGNKEPLSGMIIDDSHKDYCIFVRNQDLIEYYETRKKSLLKRVYFKDLKNIDYQ